MWSNIIYFWFFNLASFWYLIEQKLVLFSFSQNDSFLDKKNPLISSLFNSSFRSRTGFRCVSRGCRKTTAVARLVHTILRHVAHPRFGNSVYNLDDDFNDHYGRLPVPSWQELQVSWQKGKNDDAHKNPLKLTWEMAENTWLWRYYYYLYEVGQFNAWIL